MILTRQQRFLLKVMEDLGGARTDQLATMLRPVFCSQRPNMAAIITQNALSQMRLCNCEVRQEGDLWYLPRQKPSPERLEAIDIMLALTHGNVLDCHWEEPPLLLRFSCQEEKVRLFLLVPYQADLSYVELNRTERISQLFDGQGSPHPLPVSNKQFCAVKQKDGTYRFFAPDGQKGG